MTGAPFGRRLAADAASAGVQLGSSAAAQISAGALIVVSRGVRSGRPRLTDLIAPDIPRRLARRNALPTALVGPAIVWCLC